MEILRLVFLVSFHVFYVVFLYLNARIMPVADYKTDEMRWLTFANKQQRDRKLKCKTTKVSLIEL